MACLVCCTQLGVDQVRLVGSHGCMLYVPCCTAYYRAMPPYAARTARTRRRYMLGIDQVNLACVLDWNGRIRSLVQAGQWLQALPVCLSQHTTTASRRVARRRSCGAAYGVCSERAAQACVGGGTWRVWTNAQALGLALDFYQGKASAVVGLPREREALQERANWPHLHQNWPHLHQN